MEKILFDASTHLGQFCLSDERIRLWCKNQQSSLDERNAKEPRRMGMWSDNENGRVDRTIWSLSEDVQAAYYPFMDHFFSTKMIAQDPISEWELGEVRDIGQRGPIGLHTMSKLTCARAFLERVSEIHTLFTELLNPPVVKYMRDHNNVEIRKPEAPAEELAYEDLKLETFYQKCLKQLRAAGMDLLKELKDDRQRLSRLDYTA